MSSLFRWRTVLENRVLQSRRSTLEEQAVISKYGRSRENTLCNILVMYYLVFCVQIEHYYNT